MSADDDAPQVEISGPGVSIQIQDERTAWLAQEYIDDISEAYGHTDALSELFWYPDPSTDAASLDWVEESTDGVGGEDSDETDEQTDAADNDEVEALEWGGDGQSPQGAEPADQAEDTDDTDDDTDDADLPIDDKRWQDYDDRDDRVAAFIAAMYDFYEEPFETTAAEVGAQIGANGEGVVWSLKGLDEFDATKTDKTGTDGAAVWRIAPARDEGGEGDESEPIDGHAPKITIETRTGETALDANDVVDAIGGAPDKYQAKSVLGLSTDAFETLLDELDLTAIFGKEAPLDTDYVRETVQAYLKEVDA